MNDSRRTLPELPSGWVWTELGGIINPSKEKVNPLEFQGIPFIGLEHIEKDTGKILSHGLSNEVRSTKARFYSGDLLYGKLRPYLNKVSIADFDGVCSTDILVFSKNPNISNKYLFFRFLYGDFVKYASQNVSGVQHPRVNFKTLSQFDIAFPPLPEQHRIVARIEQLFTNLDAGVESLKAARTQLKRYRQSVLKSACEGRLVPTEAELARAEGRDYEPAEVLLERILEERRRKWKEENKGKKYKEPLATDTSGLLDLPEGWYWANAEQLTTVITDGEHITPERSESGILLLSARNILNGKLSFKKVDYVPQHVYDKISNRLKIEPGDVLLSCSGSVGRSCVSPNGLIFTLVRSVAVLKPVIENGNYISYCLRSPILQKQINEKKTQTAQSNIFQGKIRKLLFPLPPLAEQHRIVAEVERRLSVADEMENTIEQSLKQAERLRQSILKRAFEGKLVPQDRNDEPAEVLLERIKEEKEKREAEEKVKKKSKRKNNS